MSIFPEQHVARQPSGELSLIRELICQIHLKLNIQVLPTERAQDAQQNFFEPMRLRSEFVTGRLLVLRASFTTTTDVPSCKAPNLYCKPPVQVRPCLHCWTSRCKEMLSVEVKQMKFPLGNGTNGCFPFNWCSIWSWLDHRRNETGVGQCTVMQNMSVSFYLTITNLKLKNTFLHNCDSNTMLVWQADYH